MSALVRRGDVESIGRAGVYWRLTSGVKAARSANRRRGGAASLNPTPPRQGEHALFENRVRASAAPIPPRPEEPRRVQQVAQTVEQRQTDDAVERDFTRADVLAVIHRLRHVHERHETLVVVTVERADDA